MLSCDIYFIVSRSVNLGVGYKYACKLCTNFAQKSEITKCFDKLKLWHYSWLLTFLKELLTPCNSNSSRGKAALRLNLGTRRRSVVDCTLWQLYPLRYLSNRSLGGLWSQSGTFWRREKSLAPTGSWTLDSLAHSVVTALTELFRLL